jgi:hypothetical protein
LLLTCRISSANAARSASWRAAIRVIAASDFTPFGALAYDDQPAISIQLHPEFEPAYAKALIESRRGTRFSPAQADAAIASLDAPDDRARVGGWIRRFLALAKPT